MSEVATAPAPAGTALAVPPPPKAALEIGAKVSPIVPRNVDEAVRLAKAVIIAGLAPDSYKGRNDDETASRVLIGILKGAEVGFPPITALSTIAIINGRPCIYGDGAIALAQGRGLVDKQETVWLGEEDTEDFTCRFVIWRRGQELPYEGEFSIKDAKKAKLLGKPGPWLTYTKRMMFNRARAFALRDGFADCLCGLSIAEEALDLPTTPEAVKADSFLNDDEPSAEVVPGPGANVAAE
jgi:hypothetical protein